MRRIFYPNALVVGMTAPTPVPSARPRPSGAGIAAIVLAVVLLVVSIVLYLRSKTVPGTHDFLYSGAAFVGFLVLLGVGIALLRRPRPGAAASAPRSDPTTGDAGRTGPDVDVLVPSPPVGVSDYAAQSPHPPPASPPPTQDVAIREEAEDRDAPRRERRECPRCGTPNPIDFEVCERCGAALQPPSGPR